MTKTPAGARMVAREIAGNCNVRSWADGKPYDSCLDTSCLEEYYCIPCLLVAKIEEALLAFATQETAALEEEIARLRGEAEPLLARVERMLSDGPDCDCEGIGHSCGYTDMKREADHLREALGGGGKDG